jgi:hypothetical protein
VVLLIGVAIPVGQRAWRRYVLYRDARQYAAMRSARNWQLGSPGSSIDGGRGIPEDYVILVRRGNTFGCFIPRKQMQRGESIEYDWYYREGGGGKFDLGDPSVKAVRGTRQSCASGTIACWPNGPTFVSRGRSPR